MSMWSGGGRKVFVAFCLALDITSFGIFKTSRLLSACTISLDVGTLLFANFYNIEVFNIISALILDEECYRIFMHFTNRYAL